MNDLDEEMQTQEEQQCPLNITESITESITDNTHSNKPSPIQPTIESSSISSTGRFDVCPNVEGESSVDEHGLTALKTVVTQERTELLDPNNDVLPLINPSHIDLDNRVGADSPENTETTPKSGYLNNGQNLSQAAVTLPSEKPIVTCPENETQSEKNPEMAASALHNDANAQYRADEFRDIQNSVPYTSENHYPRVANPINKAENNEHSEKAAKMLSSTKNNSTIPASNISSPSDTNEPEEKNPEQECAALINDGNAQIMGTGYRDLQNSFPDSMSSNEREES